MRGDRKTTVINGFAVTYEEHRNQQGTHRIASETVRWRVLPDGHTTAKKRYELISDALNASYGPGDVVLRLVGKGLKVERISRATDQERLLILLHEGPFCGVEVEYMNRYAARICELRDKGWPILSEWCRRHNHRGRQSLYYLEGHNG